MKIAIVSDALLSRGMGRDAYLGLEKSGIKPIVTDVPDINTTLKAVLNNTIISHTGNPH